jgi:hypothetical protein
MSRVTVKIASIQGSKRLTFCSATVMSPEPLVPSQQHHEGLLAGWATVSEPCTPRH